VEALAYLGEGAIGSIMPIARQAKWNARRYAASACAALSTVDRDPGIVFLVGCGRSGTTILGRLLAVHPKIRYLNEPLDIWFAVEPRTDCIDFFGGKGLCHLDEGHVNRASVARARGLFGVIQALSPGKLLVEKLPSNAWRLRWLRVLFPKARFIHIVRDGWDVIRSIATLAANTTYKVSGRRAFNQWWGVANYKLERMIEEAPRYVDYHYRLVKADRASAAMHTTFAAHEWISANLDVEEARRQLELGAGDYFFLRYEDLLQRPMECLEGLFEWLAVGEVEGASRCRMQALWRPKRANSGWVALEDWVVRDFGRVMDRYGYGM
jgi:hypothetical protein